MVDAVDVSADSLVRRQNDKALERTLIRLALRNRVSDLSALTKQLEDLDRRRASMYRPGVWRRVFHVAILNDHVDVVRMFLAQRLQEFKWSSDKTAFVTSTLRLVPTQNHKVTRHLLDANAQIDASSLFGSPRAYKEVNPVLAKAASLDVLNHCVFRDLILYHSNVTPLLRAISYASETSLLRAISYASETSRHEQNHVMARSWWTSLALLLRCKAYVNAKDPPSLSPLEYVIRLDKRGDVDRETVSRKLAKRLILAKARVDFLTPSDQACLQAILTLSSTPSLDLSSIRRSK
jgi:hypothetical protein